MHCENFIKFSKLSRKSLKVSGQEQEAGVLSNGEYFIWIAFRGKVAKGMKYSLEFFSTFQETLACHFGLGMPAVIRIRFRLEESRNRLKCLRTCQAINPVDLGGFFWNTPGIKFPIIGCEVEACEEVNYWSILGLLLMIFLLRGCHVQIQNFVLFPLNFLLPCFPLWRRFSHVYWLSQMFC